MRDRIWLLLLIVPWSVQAETCNPPQPANEIPDVRLNEVAHGLNDPVHITHANDGSGRLFIVEQDGTVRVLSGNRLLSAPFLDIRDRVESGGEKGLLSIAFHPDFRRNGRFFVNYTADKRSLHTVVSEFRQRPDGRVDHGSERILLEVRQPWGNHNGGQLAFGPDGYLYIGMGDGGSADDPHDNGQNLGTLLGAILRIDVDNPDKKPYAIPPDNPFVSTRGARPEIWAYGLRNPWRFSFDHETGDLYAADVGQNEVEEIDIIEKGGNYGWRIMEGPICTPGVNPQCKQTGLIPPIYSYRHDVGRSITGGHIYRGKRFPALCGTYLYGDFVSQAIWGLRYRDGKVIAHKTLFDPRSLLRLAIDFFDDDGLLISSFGEDQAGEVYVAAYRSGRIYRIEQKE